MPCNAMEDFHRTIGLHVLKLDGTSALLTGTIKDRFHDIQMEVDVRFRERLITGIRVDFRRAPSTTCCEVTPRLESLVGMQVGPGMSKRILSALGGGEGCGNLRNLLQSLLPLVLNLEAAEGIEDEEAMLDIISERLTGSCIGYRETVSG